MHRILRKRLLVFRPLAGVVLQDDLIVVVGALRVAVNSVGYRQVAATVALAECRTERDAVEAAATETVVGLLAEYGRHLRLVVFEDRRQIHRRHDAVLLGTHALARDFIDVENRYVERIFELFVRFFAFEDAFAYRVVLVFERTVEPAVLVVEFQTSEVSEKSRYRADDVARHVGLDENRREREVHVFALGVHRDALHVSGFPDSGVDVQRKRILRLRACAAGECQRKKKRKDFFHFISGLVIACFICVRCRTRSSCPNIRCCSRSAPNPRGSPARRT